MREAAVALGSAFVATQPGDDQHLVRIGSSGAKVARTIVRPVVSLQVEFCRVLCRLLA
jgi:hypothetical protein